LDLCHKVNPIAKDGVDVEQETSQPERPAFPAAQKDDADHNGWNAQGLDDPSILHRVAFKEGFTDRKMRDRQDLEQECPNNEQFVEMIQFCHLHLHL
jgi:hypothetical protein